MNQENDISVVIPTFNRREKVRNAARSVLSQSDTVLEIIIVDDGSTDGTAEALRDEFGDRIRVIAQSNAGVSAARNRGVQVAQGEWIAFLDSDDLWHPDKIRLQMSAIRSQPDCVLAYSAWTPSLDELQAVVGEPSFTRIDRPLGWITRHPTSAPWLPTWVIRKDAVIQAGMFDRRLKVAEDTRLLYRVAELGPFLGTETPLAWRSTEIDASKLTIPKQRQFQRTITRATAEILAEASIRAMNEDRETKRQLDRMLAYYLRREAEFAASDGNYRLSRELARRSLYLRPRRRDAMAALVSAIAPQYTRRRLSKKDGSQAPE